MDTNNVYIFTQDYTEKNTYIGISQNLYLRLITHYQETKNSNPSGKFYPFFRENIDLINFHIIKSFPTYHSVYLKQYGNITTNFSTILTAFNAFRTAVYEQALFTSVNPGLNANLRTQITFFN